MCSLSQNLNLKLIINDHMYSGHILGPWFHLLWLAVWAVECRDLSWLSLGEIQFWVFLPISAQKRHLVLRCLHITIYIDWDFLYIYTKKFWICRFGSPNIYPFFTEIHSFIYILFILDKNNYLKAKKWM